MNKIKELINATADELEGTIVKARGTKYILEKERMPHSCMGCAFYHSTCPASITQYCLKGLILKRVSE